MKRAPWSLLVALIGGIWHGCHPGHDAAHAHSAPASLHERAPAHVSAAPERDAGVSLTLIAGHYEILRAAPDGDSVKFYPAHRADWNALGRRARIRSNRRGGAQLRLEGIDALETHYAPGNGTLGTLHQPLDLARGAAAGLVEWLGFTHVRRNERDTVTHAEPARVQGYILARAADKYGRCVAFAFRGNPPGKTGDRVPLDDTLLRRSLNHDLLERGLVYPTYYAPLHASLRSGLTRAVRAAQAAHRGVWAHDRTRAGLVVGSLEQVQSDAYIMPKLFRRLTDYFEQNGGTQLDRFASYLSAHPDAVRVISTDEVVTLDRLVQVDGQRVRLLSPIDDLMFLGDSTRVRR